MKKYTIITIIAIVLLLGFLTGLYLYRINKTDITEEEIIAETIEDECTAIAKLSNKELPNIIQTSKKEEKTSPNCIITLKVYYEKCEHLIETRKNIEEVEVNLTEEELEQRFNDWEIQNSHQMK